jgi:hypothetical protein
MADEPEDEAARRLAQHDISELPVLRRVVGPLLQSE